MTDPSSPSAPEPSERTRLLRAAADDMLTSAERAALDAHLAAHPEDEAVIAFERGLRSELGSALAGAAAPGELEQRLRDMAVRAQPRARRRVVKMLAAAVVLAVAAFGLRTALRGDADDFGFAGRAGLVRFLATHPNDCPISIDRAIDEFQVQRFASAMSELDTVLGRAAALGALSETDLRFHGMRRCGGPGHELSMHLVFSGARGSSLEGSVLSVYVQPDDGRLPISEGGTYRLVPKTQQFSRLEMFVWKRNGLDYFVVTPTAEAGRVALASAGAPPVSAAL